MKKTGSERVRDWRRRHPERAQALYATYKLRRKARKEAELAAKRERMAAIVEEFQKVKREFQRGIN